jgi:CHASE2 domain-containing sensor protein
MADIQKRGGYTPRRTREQRAYRLVVAAGTTGVIGVVGLVLAIAGVWSAFWPILLIIISVLCVVGFRRATG